MCIFKAEYTDDSVKEFVIENGMFMSEEEVWITAYRLANGYAPDHASIVTLTCIAM